MDVRLQPHLEQQEDDAELREQMDRRVLRVDQAQAGDADEGAADQLTEDRGLAEALGDLAEELRRGEDGDEREEKLRDVQNRKS